MVFFLAFGIAIASTIFFWTFGSGKVQSWNDSVGGAKEEDKIWDDLKITNGLPSK